MLKIIVLGLIAILFQFPNAGLLEYAPIFNKVTYVFSMLFFGLTCVFIGIGIKKKQESKT